MYSYFHEEGLSVKTMEDLSQAEALTDLVFPVSDANYEFARDYYDVESFKQAWASIFEALKSE